MNIWHIPTWPLDYLYFTVPVFFVVSIVIFLLLRKTAGAVLGLALPVSVMAGLLVGFLFVGLPIQFSQGLNEQNVSLQHWLAKSYGIRVTPNEASKIVPNGDGSASNNATAVNYKGRIIVVKLTSYKDGFILTTAKTELALPQK